MQKLIEAVVPEVLVINEPERVHCGSPDLVLLENNIAVFADFAFNSGSHSTIPKALF